METISVVNRKIKAKSLDELPAIKDLKDTSFDSLKQEVSFRVNRFGGKKCHRLVHDGKKVLAFFESDAITETIHPMVCGTKTELEQFIKDNKLEYTPEENYEMVNPEPEPITK